MQKFLFQLAEPIFRYFAGTLYYSRFRFIVEFALLAFPLKVLVLIPWMLLGLEVNSTTEAVDTGSTLRLFVLGCIIAPMSETLIGQWLPIRLLYFYTKDRALILVGSAIFFAAQHLYVGFAGFIYTFPIAILLSWSFLAYRRHSRWEAYWVTTAIHSLHNFIAFYLYVMSGRPA